MNRPAGVFSWITCGATATSGGCFASGSVAVPGQTRAMLQGASRISGDTVYREVYALDDACRGGAKVVLHV